MIKSKRIRSLFMIPFSCWAVLFVILPLLFVVYYGLSDRYGTFTLENLGVIFRWEYAKALGLSAGLALISTGFCLLLAYPLCMILAEKKLNGGGELVLLYVFPLWMNSLLSTLAWQTILERNGIINMVIRFFGGKSVQLLNTPLAIVLGMIYNFLPYMVLPIYNNLASIDRNLYEAASDLGANRVQTFLRITFPLSLSGVVSGITMVFIPALTTFVISSLLGGGKILLIGNIIDQQFTSGYNWHLGSALSMILMIFILMNMLLQSFTDQKGIRR